MAEAAISHEHAPDPTLDASVSDELGDSFNQYVTYFVDNECFGFPMESVLEIIRVPDTVRVPLTPGGLVGLANLRGSILPVVDLRRSLGLPEVEYNDATRVVVSDCGRPVGLVVDRVARVLNVEPDKIESSDSVQGTVDAELLTGVIKNFDGHELIQLLDVTRIVSLEFAAVTAAANDTKTETGLAGELLGGNSPIDEEEDDAIQLVSLLVDGQEHAFNISEVDEIVRVPDEISLVPRAEPHVVGLVNLRGRLLPLVSLRRIFALEDAPIDEHNRVLVVRFASELGHSESVGVVVDQVREVLRVPSDVQEQMPRLLTQKKEINDITAVCRLEGGKRLVSILSASALFRHPEVQAAVNAGREKAMEMDGNDDLIEDEELGSGGEETQLVVFQLNKQEYGAPIESVQEIIRIPDEITRVPKTPAFIEGMINLRGSVLPVTEMRIRFGLDRLERNDHQRIIVLGNNGVRTGFIVDSVTEVLRLPRNAIEESPNLSENQARIMGKVANLKDARRMILILDVKELLNDPDMREFAKSANVDSGTAKNPDVKTTKHSRSTKKIATSVAAKKEAIVA